VLKACHHWVGEEGPVVAFAKGGNSDELGVLFPISVEMIPKYSLICDCQRSQLVGDVAHQQI